jgi:accessory colonization factor AcfC
MAAAVGLAMVIAMPAFAAETLHIYGPGGPLPAMQEAAFAFRHAHGVEIEVTAGPISKWIDSAKQNADLIFSGSEVMMSDFIEAMPDIDPQTVEPLYLRESAILVRPGNPNHISGVADLLKPGHSILVVNGAGQQGLWEDVAGRLGDIGSVRAFRRNIARVAKNSAEAKAAWVEDKTLDAWLIWTIWQKSNPTLADQVTVEPRYAIFRDTGVALTKRGQTKSEAKLVVAFLTSAEGAAIFRKWGWIAPAK